MYPGRGYLAPKQLDSNLWLAVSGVAAPFYRSTSLDHPESPREYQHKYSGHDVNLEVRLRVRGLVGKLDSGKSLVPLIGMELGKFLDCEENWNRLFFSCREFIVSLANNASQVWWTPVNVHQNSFDLKYCASAPQTCLLCPISVLKLFPCEINLLLSYTVSKAYVCHWQSETRKNENNSKEGGLWNIAVSRLSKNSFKFSGTFRNSRN